jgi:lysophospholipase L1-like esterase
MSRRLHPVPLSRRAVLGAAFASGLYRTAEAAMPMPHLVLLGDSIFDNKAYVGTGSDVIAQVRERLEGGGEATLLARDGAVVAGVLEQVRRIPSGATHIVVSAGGNDALRESGVLQERASSVAEVFGRISLIREGFRREYREMVATLKATGLPVLAATVYDPRYADAMQRDLATVGLAFINDVILREAFAQNVDVLDLRLICDDDADFANPIEPSSRGGAKMAAAIVAYVRNRESIGSGVVAR